MANRRMISKVISVSEKVNSTSIYSQLLYTWMIAHTDDFGRISGSAKKIRVMVVPFHKKTDKDIENSLVEMENTGLILRYPTPDDPVVIQILNFEEHQSGLNKRTTSKYMSFEEVSKNFPELLINSQPRARAQNGMELNGMELNGREGELPPSKIPDTTPEPIKTWAECLCHIPGYRIAPERTIQYLTEKQTTYPIRIITTALECFIDKKLYGERLTASPLGQLTTYIQNEYKWAKARGEDVHKPKPLPPVEDNGEATASPEAIKIVREMQGKYFTKGEIVT